MDTVLTLSSKNQLTLPVSLVSFLGLGKGAKLWTKLINKTIVIEKVEDSWDQFQGLLANHPMSKKYTTLEIIAIAKKREAKRLAKKYGK
ncbi:MAG: hypothetical protein U1C50_01880 [Patescibacteria group bacterium]|nr:hypothetical protein [Patescibacteria group bacterium]MDP4031148.1 hypothetical protein [Candidatus Beckwithbacteria bacterium]MDZ4228984.1 hypothetical protein [Patescibacteria group bacterium]